MKFLTGDDTGLLKLIRVESKKATLTSVDLASCQLKPRVPGGTTVLLNRGAHVILGCSLAGPFLPETKESWWGVSAPPEILLTCKAPSPRLALGLRPWTLNTSMPEYLGSILCDLRFPTRCCTVLIAARSHAAFILWPRPEMSSLLLLPPLLVLLPISLRHTKTMQTATTPSAAPHLPSGQIERVGERRRGEAIHRICAPAWILQDAFRRIGVYSLGIATVRRPCRQITQMDA